MEKVYIKLFKLQFVDELSVVFALAVLLLALFFIWLEHSIIVQHTAATRKHEIYPDCIKNTSSKRFCMKLNFFPIL